MVLPEKAPVLIKQSGNLATRQSGGGKAGQGLPFRYVGPLSPLGSDKD